MKNKILCIALIAVCVVILRTMAPVDAHAAGDSDYSTNVSVETDATYYYCAQGQKFKIVITVKTEEPYEEGKHKYIGYLAFLNNGWQQVKSWNIDGGIVEYTFTLNSNDFAAYYDKPYLFFTASVFPVDKFVEGASLYDKNFQVKFIKPSFDITFDANGGQCSEPTGKVIYNLAYGTLPVPERAGYTFKGWHTSASGGTQIESDTIVSAMSDHTLYAQWQPNAYTVILDANGGVCDPLSISAVYDQKYSKLSDVSVEPPEGKYFAGWYTSASGGTKITNASTVSIAANHTLYAQWRDIVMGSSPASYTVAYDANGGAGAPADQMKTDGKALTLSDVVPTREGYDFLGWSQSSTAGTAEYRAGGSYADNRDVTLYAVWKLKTYYIAYSANGGASAPFTQTKIHDVALALSSTIPTRSGHDFLGWSSNKSASVAAYKAGDRYTDNGDVTLYAVWRERPKGSENQDQDSNASTGGSAQTTAPKAKKSQIISASSKTLVYKGKSISLGAKTTGDGKLSYSSSNKKIVTVSAFGIVTPKECGTATITIKAAETGKYTAQKKVITVKVILQRPVLKLKWVGSSTAKLSWTKVPGASGYKVYNYDAKKKKYVHAVTKKANQSSARHKGLKKGKTYQYKVRAYRKVGKKIVYGSYSKAVKVRR